VAGATYICGPGPVARQPCPKGGPDHEPFPTGYIGAGAYAEALLAAGLDQEQCPACGRWAMWVPVDAPRPTDW
jgi:hypothetical protein